MHLTLHKIWRYEAPSHPLGRILASAPLWSHFVKSVYFPRMKCKSRPLQSSHVASITLPQPHLLTATAVVGRSSDLFTDNQDPHKEPIATKRENVMLSSTAIHSCGFAMLYHRTLLSISVHQGKPHTHPMSLDALLWLASAHLLTFGYQPRVKAS